MLRLKRRLSEIEGIGYTKHLLLDNGVREVKEFNEIITVKIFYDSIIMAKEVKRQLPQLILLYYRKFRK